VGAPLSTRWLNGSKGRSLKCAICGCAVDDRTMKDWVTLLSRLPSSVGTTFGYQTKTIAWQLVDQPFYFPPAFEWMSWCVAHRSELCVSHGVSGDDLCQLKWRVGVVEYSVRAKCARD
jgi:hypothetical protein